MSLFGTVTVDQLNERMCNGNMLEHLQITFSEVGEDYLVATMPVDHRTQQPLGLLHGGASVVLAESIGSVAGNLVVYPQKKYCVGLEINANHIKAVRDGVVKGITRPIHIGGSTHVWATEVKNEQDQLVCIGRITLAVLSQKND